MALSDTTVLQKDITAADHQSWNIDFLDFPKPLPSHLEDLCTGSWEYFYYVHGTLSPEEEKNNKEKTNKTTNKKVDDTNHHHQPNTTNTTTGSNNSVLKRPRKINVRYHVHDIKDINEVAGTVYIDFSVQCTWIDPVIAYAAKQIIDEQQQNGISSSSSSPSPSSSSPILRRTPSSLSPKLLRSNSSIGGGNVSPTSSNNNNNNNNNPLVSNGSSIFLLTTNELNDIWLPDVSVPNALENNNNFSSNSLVRIRDPLIGKIEQRLRYHGIINNRMDLRCFPFDADLILFSITSSFPSSQVLLIPDPLFPVAKTYIRHNLTEWEVDPLPVIATGLSSAMGDSVFNTDEGKRIGDIVSTISTTGTSMEEDEATGDANSTCHLVLKVRRNPFFYLWKMVAVQEIVAMWSWTVFYHDPDDIPGRMSTTLTLFLSSVAFLHVINDRLPRMPYLTVLDKFTYISFFLLFLTAYENLCVYYASHHMGNRELAVILDVFARFAFPLMHIASCIALYIQVRNSRRTELKLGNEL